MLVQAKAALEDGEFRTLIEKELPFQKSAAAALMLIARHEVISNVQHVGHLPASWGTLAVLAQLSESQFLKQLKAGAIHSEMEPKGQ